MYFSILDESFCFDDFDCRETELNDFIRKFALLFQRRRFGVTIVCCDRDDLKKKIIGYYTLCPASVQRELLPSELLTGPRPNPIPGFRLCRLAIDKNFQNKGYGKLLFIHSLKKSLDQANHIGGSVVIVDAKHQRAKQFYERFGFKPLSQDSLTLVQTIKFIEKHFA